MPAAKTKAKAPESKPAAKGKAKGKAPTRKPAARAAKSKPVARSKPAAKSKPVQLLAGGNPRIAKADGDAPVQAYIAALPGWKREIGRRVDALVVRSVPGVCKAVKWNSPFYGLPGQGWLLSLHAFKHYVKLAFFRGSALRPLPPGDSTSEDTRYLDVHETDQLNERQLGAWLKQAAALPGWKP